MDRVCGIDKPDAQLHLVAHTEWVIVRITERRQVRATGDVTFPPWGQRIMGYDAITGPSVDHEHAFYLIRNEKFLSEL